jgi:Serine aminopeptidase, S33
MDHSQRSRTGLALNTRRQWLASLAAAGTLSACGSGGRLWQPSPIKMDQTLDDRACPNTQAPVLMVLLPGAYMTPQELQDEGFVQAVRQRKLAVDVLIADAHMGYVYDGSMLQRLHSDVIAPARAQGYQRIWFMGISLGGYVGMGYALRNPGVIEGLVLLAPYLGRRPLVQAVAAAGGPARWRQNAQPRDNIDIDHELWMWLSDPQRHAAGALPQLHLGYGLQDRFAEGHALLASSMPVSRVSTAPGGHDWPPWRTLWAQWLDQRLLPSQCVP